MIQTHFPYNAFPLQAADYCNELWRKWEFDFKVVRPRATKLGDFRYQLGRRPLITINNNLNPYSFLITYLHEVAHCVVFRQYRKKVAPHGAQWKKAFSELLQPVLSEAILPVQIVLPLRKYAAHPKASTSADAALSLVLSRYDQSIAMKYNDGFVLGELTIGTLFKFRNRTFEKSTLRRTRILCIDQQNLKKYTLPAHALVEIC